MTTLNLLCMNNACSANVNLPMETQVIFSGEGTYYPNPDGVYVRGQGKGEPLFVGRRGIAGFVVLMPAAA